MKRVYGLAILCAALIEAAHSEFQRNGETVAYHNILTSQHIVEGMLQEAQTAEWLQTRSEAARRLIATRLTALLSYCSKSLTAVR